MFPEKPFPGLCHICYEGSFFLFSMQCSGSFKVTFVRKPFAMFSGKPFTRCLQCLSESLLPDVCNVCQKAFNQMFAMLVGKLVSCKTGNWDRWSGGGAAGQCLPSIKSGSLKFRSGRRLLSHFLKQSIENGKGDILLCSCSFPCFSATWFVFKESFLLTTKKLLISHERKSTRGNVCVKTWKLSQVVVVVSTPLHCMVRLLYPGKVENGSWSNDFAS